MSEENKNAQNSKILIVDDDKFLLDMYSLKFTSEGFEVHTSLASSDVAVMIDDATLVPDIMLVDLVMPSVDGFELIEKVRAQEAFNQTVLIVLSNLGESVDIEKARKLGADGYIIKANVTPSEVVEKVLEIVKEKKQG